MIFALSRGAVLCCRRGLRNTWWQLVDDVQVAAEAAARQAEVHAWKTQGAAVKVSMAVSPVSRSIPSMLESVESADMTPGRAA